MAKARTALLKWLKSGMAEVRNALRKSSDDTSTNWFKVNRKSDDTDSGSV
jgi:hypothetical protein